MFSFVSFICITLIKYVVIFIEQKILLLQFGIGYCYYIFHVCNKAYVGCYYLRCHHNNKTHFSLIINALFFITTFLSMMILLKKYNYLVFISISHKISQNFTEFTFDFSNKIIHWIQKTSRLIFCKSPFYLLINLVTR